MSTPDIPLNVRGAVDLAALAAQREAQERAATAAANGTPALIVDVTEANFESLVLQQSMTVPVVLDLWADWCQPCKTLTPILEGLAAEYAGQFVLAKVDVDANPRISQAFQVQSIPSVFAVIQGQPLPLFQGALPQPQVRQYIDALLAEAEKAGMAGAPEVAPSEPGEDVPVDPDEEAAYAAMEAGDWAAAEAAFATLLERRPGDEHVRAGLSAASLYRRIGDVDQEAAVAAADAAPTDVAAQGLAADIAAANGDVAGAFTRLIDTVRVTAGDDRAAARAHLIELFDVIGPQDPKVIAARSALANALF